MSQFPESRLSNSFDTIDVLFYRFTPVMVAILLLVSSACLFAHVRLSK